MNNRITFLLISNLLLSFFCCAQNWSTPILISDMPGINNNQDLCIDRIGTRHVVWSHKVLDGYWVIMYSKSTTGGTTWSTPDTIVNLPGAWLYEPHIVSDTMNNLYVSFDSISQGGSFGQVYLIIKEGDEWGTPKRLTNEYELAMHSLLTIDGNNRLYVFWQGYYNQNYKFIYKYLENEILSEQIIPFVDSNYYSLRSIKTDKLNNLHCNGLFKFFGQGNQYPRVSYTKFESASNQWQPTEDLNINNSNNGCDIAIDTNLFPCIVWGQKINATLPYEYATVLKGYNLAGWGKGDTINKVEEYNHKIIVDKNNAVHIIDCYVLPDNNTLTTFNYYSMSTTGWSKEILDENGSIIMFDIEATNETVDIVYGKMIDRAGQDTVRTYFINKSILVGLTQAVDKGQPLFVYPNPSNTSATIGVDIAKPVPASLYLLDQSGKIIKTFFENKTLTQKNETIYNLTDNYGGILPSGTYLLVLKSDKFIHVKQLVKQ